MPQLAAFPKGFFDAIVEGIGEDDVLLRVEPVGICGSDVHQYTTSSRGRCASRSCSVTSSAARS